MDTQSSGRRSLTDKPDSLLVLPDDGAARPGSRRSPPARDPPLLLSSAWRPPRLCWRSSWLLQWTPAGRGRTPAGCKCDPATCILPLCRCPAACPWFSKVCSCRAPDPRWSGTAAPPVCPPGLVHSQQHWWRLIINIKTHHQWVDIKCSDKRIYSTVK